MGKAVETITTGVIISAIEYLKAVMPDQPRVLACPSGHQGIRVSAGMTEIQLFCCRCDRTHFTNAEVRRRLKLN